MKSKIKRDRKVRRGFDVEKLTKIWNVLNENSDWLHIAEISRRTGIDDCTVRWYLDNYLKGAIDEEKIVPTIRLRLIKLKSGMSLESYIMALKLIRKVKTDKVVKRD